MSGRSLNLVVIEDHLAIRKGLELLLRRAGHHVVGVGDTAEEGMELVETRRPDVVIVDVGLPGESGAQLCRRLLERDPDTAVLIYTGVSDIGELRRALDCGARGFLLKTGPPEDLAFAVETVAAGGTYVDPGLKPLLAGSAARDVLSPREQEIFSLLAAGRTAETAAAELFLSPHTVRTHIRNAMKKLGSTTRTHATVLAIARGEVTPADDLA